MRSFLDTNLLVYADAADGGDKQLAAIATIREHMLAGTGVISTQVLQEYVSAALKKLRLPQALIRSRLGFYAGFEVVPASVPLIVSALDLQTLHSLSFWDAMILQAARQSGCAVLLSEDMQEGATLVGVRIVNPLRPGASFA